MYLAHYSSGIGTCSTISRPNPSKAGMCMGVFDSKRMRRMPKSERIWPPRRWLSVCARCGPASLRARATAGVEQAGRRSTRARHSMPPLHLARKRSPASPLGQSQSPARCCAGRAAPRSPPRRSCAAIDPESRGSRSLRQRHRPPCSGCERAPARAARKARATPPALAP